jgi:hypothetical protein
MTAMLAGWTTNLWQPPALPPPSIPTELGKAVASDPTKPAFFYIDGHHKPVYSQQLIPRGLVGKLGKVLGNRALVCLHDHKGHPLLVTTGRGDTHLTVSLPQTVELYEQVNGLEQVKVKAIVVDREGMAGAFLSKLSQQGRQVITILRSDQYKDLSSFSHLGQFNPYTYNRHGQVKREIAAAHFDLKLEDGASLALEVALLRELSPANSEANRVLVQGGPEQVPAAAGLAQSKACGELKLIPIVTTASPGVWESSQLADIYTGRWAFQENIFRDWLLPLGLDINHGYAKRAVENSEVRSRRQKLQERLTNSQRYTAKAEERTHKATELYAKRRQKVRGRNDLLNRNLWRQESELAGMGQPRPEIEAILAEQQGRNRAELEQLQEKEWRAYRQSNAEYLKAQAYQRRGEELQAELVALQTKERAMAELDNRKDQIMSCLVVALANLGMWVGEQYFPSSYGGARWKRLAPFFKLGGWVRQDLQTIQVNLRGFNNSELNRDLREVCEKVNIAQLKMADGRQLLLGIEELPKGSKVSKLEDNEQKERSLCLVT